MPRKEWNFGRRNGDEKRRLNFGCWNVQGISNKINMIPSELDIFQMDCTVISETKRKGKGEEEVGNYIHIWSGVSRATRAKAGVSIMILKKWKKNITNWECINERIIIVEMTIFSREIVIIGAYAPTNNTRDQEKDTFWTILRETIEKIPRRKEIILMGDLNAKVGIQESSQVIGKYGDIEYNDNGERLIEICEQFNLQITNTFFQHKDIHKYTWQQNSKELRSLIDYIIIRQNSTFKANDVRAYRGAQCGSDHFLVKMKCFWPWQNRGNGNESPHGSNQTEKCQDKKLNIDSLHDESIRKLLASRMDNTLDELYDGSAEEIYEYLKSNIRKIGQEVLGEKVNNYKQKEEWWSEEIQQEIQEKRNAYHTWLNNKTEETRKIYNEKKHKVLRKIRNARNETWEKTCADVNSKLGFRRSKEAWSVLKGLRQETKRKTNLQMITLREWEDYFKKLLNEDRDEYIEETAQEFKGSDLQITETEVLDEIMIGKNGKSPGPGNINLEIIKYGGTKIAILITKCLNKILHGDQIPSEMKLGYIVSIFKKGDRKVCSNYRGICIMNTLMKIFAKVLQRRLESMFQTQEEQCGFTTGRSCIDHIFTVRQILEKCNEKREDIGLVFIDLEKAYDTVPRKLLWQALHMANIDDPLINILQELYRNNTCQIKSGNILSSKFRTSKGLLQGCPMSPTLFKIYIDICLKQWYRKCNRMGIEIADGKYLLHLLFADDQMVVTQDGEDANYICNQLSMTYKKWGLQINYKKTEYLSNDMDELYIDGNRIRKVNNFCYLGSILEKGGTSETDINKKISNGRKVIGMLNPVLWSRNIINSTKRIIFKSIFQSIVFYGAETWTTNRRQLKKLSVLEMDFWRRAARVSRVDKIRNTEIRRRMEVEEDSNNIIERKRLEWYGHVRRMEEGRIPKYILEWEIEKRRRRGRPNISWINNVQMSMERIGAEEEDVQDREKWRNIIRN